MCVGGGDNTQCFNPFLNKPWFLRVCSTSPLATSWEKEKNVRYNEPRFLRACITSPLKTLGKGEIARYEQFLLFPQCFQFFWRTFHHFHQTQNCRLQILLIWKSLEFVVLERVNISPAEFVLETTAYDQNKTE